MTVCKSLIHRADRRSLLLLGASMATLASGLATCPASAQTLSARLAAQYSAPTPPRQAPTAVPLRSGTMRDSLARQRATQSRTEQIRAYILSARAAATAANGTGVTDGLSRGGLDPTGLVSQAIAAARAGDTAQAARLLVSAGAANDPTGLATWQGAGLPSEAIVDGRTQVTITQTQERALLSWNSFNIGANTSLRFDQTSNGVAQPGWVAVNRVTSAVAPSQILGSMTAAGTVVVLNQSGIIFGKTSQVNTHSLLASTLELGQAARFVSGSTGATRATTIKDRSDAYLANGLFLPGNGTASPNGDDGAALLVSGMTQGTGTQFATIEGGIGVEQGARVTAGAGGFLILAAPVIDSAGILVATDGQVSLQAGRAVNYTQSTGAASDPDPFVRGYTLNSYAYQGQADGLISVSGLIDSRRGYISLGTGANGTITHGGLLSATTSVSRNGKISITAGTISLLGNRNAAMASGLEILADTNGETIPQGSATVASGFKTSQVVIGTQVQDPAQPVGGLVATSFSMGQNAVILAPGANVAVGGDAIAETLTATYAKLFPGSIDIAACAVIDVGGLKDVQLAAARNQIAITPVKRGELRDTPAYREVALDGNFSLNGATLYVDPRVSGVRADGVAWLGSPLIEAGSLAGQIPATAAEFMTKGGTVLLGTTQNIDYATIRNVVSISAGATIDISGGWVNYAAGTVRTSRLVTNDGRIVDIGQASPNDVYVAVADGFTEIQPRFGIVRNFYNVAAQGQRFDASYDEGRDAGTLTIKAAAVAIDGTVNGDSFAGMRQVNTSVRPSLKSASSARALQKTPYELPSAGMLAIDTLGDVIVYHGVRGSGVANHAELLLSDTMLSAAGLSELALVAAGSVTFARATTTVLQTSEALTLTGMSTLTLAPGGALSVAAGRSIRFDGAIDVASGTITAQTQVVGRAADAPSGGIMYIATSNGSLFRTGLYGVGTGDDLSKTSLYARDLGAFDPFDLVVTGTLSTAGQWINDYRETGIRRGGAFADGGSISLTVAPRVFGAIGTSLSTAIEAFDLSGSIYVTGALAVGSGGFVNATGGLVLTGKGGNLSLINATTYASTNLTLNGLLSQTAEGLPLLPIDGTTQSVDFTPVPGGAVPGVFPSLVPTPRSTIDIANASLDGFGFGGGGTFTIVAPDMSFGSDQRAGSTHIGFDIFQETGFATLNASTYRSRIVGDVFANDRVSNSAFLETTRFTVGDGETLDLTQWVRPSIMTVALNTALVALASGADLSALALLQPIRPVAAWDREAANLVLGGLTELDVLAGGRIVGSPLARITTTKFYNAGTVDLPGGTIAQQGDPVASLVIAGLGIHDVGKGGKGGKGGKVGKGLADAFGGGVDEQGRFGESAANAAGLTTGSGTASRLLTNAELVSREGSDRLIYFLGLLDESDGIVLDTGSVTDLSGIALIDPRAAVRANGDRLRQGRVIDGGMVTTAALRQTARLTGPNAATTVKFGRTMIRRDGAALDIGGASATFDQATIGGDYVPYLAWSKAGRIAALSGGSLGTTPIAAGGGDVRAEGGTLEWLNPTITAATGDAVPDHLSATLIGASGFDSVIARGSLPFDGIVTLGLRKALMVTSQDPVAGNLLDPDATVSIGATAGTSATVTAGYIRFASRRGYTNVGVSPIGDGVIAFEAGSQGIDVAGGIGFTRSIASLTLATSGDLRLIGVNDGGAQFPVYNGMLVTGGDLMIDARRTYATTGTGNLQALLTGGTAAQTLPFDIVAIGDRRVTFGNRFLDPNVGAPLSAGTHLRVLAAEIVQNGYLAAPLGLLELGGTAAQVVGIGGFLSTPTTSVTFGAGSITTVSGAGLTVPYGTTNDLIEYFFPTLGTPITAAPTGQLTIGGGSIVQAAGARVDGRGGGDIFAYEFQSGVGGSRDVLDRFSRDGFSSNGFDPVTGLGYQYADARQVFALVPVGALTTIAPFDPLYSADYGSAGPVDLYGASAGRTVTLDGGNGIAAGEYLLIPAKYAMSIPGALRLVENTDAVAPIVGTSTRLLDGSITVGGTYGTADSGIAESTRRSFTLQSKAVFDRYSKIETTSASTYLTAVATKAGLPRPRLPLDAARVVLAPLTELRIAGAFDTGAATGGRGGQFDILGQSIVIARAGDTAATGLVLTDADLTALGATSLLIGGQRRENADGTTGITASASSIQMLNGAILQAPELLLAVAGVASSLTIADGARLIASGDLGTQSTGDFAVLGSGALVRVANGDERLTTRTGTGAATIGIGAASIAGTAFALDTSGTFQVADTAMIAAKQIAISGQAIRFDDVAAAAGQAGAIGASLETKLAAADRLTVRSPGAVLFSTGTHRFNDLVLDTATIGTIGAAAGDSGAGTVVSLAARDVRLTNKAAAADGCAATAICGEGSRFSLVADTLAFGANDMRMSGFANGVSLTARLGMYVEGKGSFAADSGLTFVTPLLVDRAALVDPRDQGVRADYALLTNGDFVMTSAGTDPTATSAGNAAPGARIAIGTIAARVRSASISGALVRATAGIVDIQSVGDIVLAGASLQTPGYEKVFGDTVDPVTVSAGGGTINLLSGKGGIVADRATTLVSDTGVGKAGTLNLLAGNGAIRLDATINPDAKGARLGSFALDAGASAYDFGAFVQTLGTRFGGSVAIRTGAGNLDLAAGQSLKAQSVALTADGGTITIAGLIDTSGVDVTGLSDDAARNAAVDGGAIALWGASGVTLAATARLDTHTTGYAASDSRPASAGDVTIGIARADAAITIRNGAVIDVGARRSQAEPGVGRLVPQVISDPATGSPVTVYRYAEPDIGGTVTLRAPVIGAGRDKVAVSLGGAIRGADTVQLEAFQRYDLDAMADTGLYSGLTRGADGRLILDMASGGANPFTSAFTLADGTPSLVRFIQDFDVSTADGSSLAGIRSRPGVELSSVGAVQTASQWNLGAAMFTPVQILAAVAAGVLRVIPELGTSGVARYAVVPGQEGALLDRFATFLYRVDGSARGEAPVVTLRAGGDLTIDRSISDGFFTFRDASDPAYLNYQLGGGDRSYSPALQFSCGGATGSCGAIGSYASGVAANPGTGGTLVISLSTAASQGQQTNGARYVNAPLALAGNGAAGAVDAAGVPVGDTLGFAELFPLLAGDVAMHASDIRLVAGAGGMVSADPLRIDRATAADMTVSGTFTYRVRAAGSVRYGGPLQFQLLRSGSDPKVNFDIGDTLGRTTDETDPTGELNGLRDDAYTQLNWGTTAVGLSADARAAALVYFAGKGYTLTGTPTARSGIIAPLSEIVGFLKTFEPTYQAALASGRTGYTANRTPALVQYGTAAQQTAADSPNLAHVRSYVRTGDGAIDVAASRDISLLGASAPVYRRDDGTLAAGPSYTGQIQTTAAQSAASAIYTAGVRVAQATVRGRIAGGALVAITPDSPYLGTATPAVDFVPSPKGLSDTAPVLAHGGGDITLAAGRDVLGRRDSWTELLTGLGQAINGTPNRSDNAGSTIGGQTQKWQVGTVGIDTEMALSPRYFTSGVGALAGGDVTIRAGRDVSDLTVALLSGVTTTTTDAGAAMLTLGNGSLSLSAGRDILAGRFDIATGAAVIHAARDVAAFGSEPIQALTPQYARVRLINAVVSVSAGGTATLGSVSALGPDGTLNSAAFFSPAAAFDLSSNETATLAETAGLSSFGRQFSFQDPGGISPTSPIQVLPPSLRMTALTGRVVLPGNLPQFLYPSAIGQLRVFSDGNLEQLVVIMSDADPALVGGAFAAPRFASSPIIPIPYVTADTSDAQLRNQHNPRITHAGDHDPVRVYTNGDIDKSALFLPKQARITAGGDIVDMFFNGQNIASDDVTRFRAGGDIVGSLGSRGDKPFVVSSDFIIGGPGTAIIEAGGDIGPLVGSANIRSILNGVTYSYAGGIRTIGNEYNPWLGDTGADLDIRFGMVGGADYTALRDTYLDPSRLKALDGDLFEQVTDSFGNASPDRGRPIYAPLLATWLRDHAPAAFAAAFGGQVFPDTVAGNAGLATAAYGRLAELYAAFKTIDPLRQQSFLINSLYFNELAQPAIIGGASYLQYIRGYRAVQTLFPTRLGYTDNLAPYTLDVATVSADHPLGEPVRTVIDGQPQRALRIHTGSIDLRLATIQTARGGDVTILGPGGSVIAGSAVRTADQPQLRATAFNTPRPEIRPNLESGSLATRSEDFASVPLGFEGVLTLRGGQIRSFTDGDFILNQSRVFSQAGGDITMWSSNGDLNAGQGPKSASNFPPITVRFDENGLAEVNSAGSVAGAGIGTFKRSPDDPAADILLIAPVGEVDAGDAGVRASGNVVVAAARVANADNFSAAGDLTGVPQSAVATSIATPTNAASAIAAQAAAAATTATEDRDRRSSITVDVLGAVDAPACDPASARADDPSCRPAEDR